MSIYPVRLQEWFPPKDEQRWAALTMLKYSDGCAHCGKKNMDPRYAWIYHAAPWGYYTEEMWCTKRCYKAYWKALKENK